MKKNPEYSLSHFVKIIFVTPEKFSHWFGYYNISPIDSDNRRMLAHRVNFDGREITSEDKAEVGWFDLIDGSWNPVGETRAFNWQQGAMLQWLGPDFAGRVIFNDVEDGHFVSRIVDCNSEKLTTVQWPIYGVTSDGEKSITLQFERSYWCRAYHYETVRNLKWDVQVAEEDGIFSIDLRTDKITRIIDIKTILEYKKDSDFDSAKHWLEHIMLNPSGSRFAFYHRFSVENGFRTRVFTADLNGRNLNLVQGWQKNSYSHLGWRTDDEFVVFNYGRAKGGRVYDTITKGSRFGKRIRKSYHLFFAPFISRKIHNTIALNTKYDLYRVDRKEIIETYNTGLLSNDGHPSFTASGLYMLTDTYADSQGYRHLLLFNTNSEKILELGRFFSPFNECSYRSDLHPRFSKDENMIIIDSAHSGKHQMMVLRLDWKGITNYLR